MQYTKKTTFEDSFSKANFLFKLEKENLLLIKKLKKPNKRDYESINKNNHFKKFLKIKNVVIKKIHIKSFNELKKKKSYKMNYINGVSGELILKNSDIQQVKVLKKFYLDFFKYTKKTIHWIELDKKIYINKITNIKKNINNKELKKLFLKCEKYLKKNLNKFKKYPKSLCHGDLTLSNIILSKNKIFLIDFLKTFNDSILQDLAKIYQEFILGWSSRKLNEREILRSQIIYEMIIDKSFFSQFSNKVLKLLKFEVLVTLLRIFPYVHNDDKVTVKWLKKSIVQILKDYNSINPIK